MSVRCTVAEDAAAPILRKHLARRGLRSDAKYVFASVFFRKPWCVVISVWTCQFRLDRPRDGMSRDDKYWRLLLGISRQPDFELLVHLDHMVGRTHRVGGNWVGERLLVVSWLLGVALRVFRVREF